MFPISFEFDFNINKMSFKRKQCSVEHMVNWHRLSERDKKAIKKRMELLINEMDILDHELYYCMASNCKNKNHHRFIDSVFENIKVALLCSTGDYSTSSEKQFNIVPGWNEYVKDLYSKARKIFLAWMSNGKPTTGAYREIMRTTRASFKQALSYCRENEEGIRNKKLAESLRNKNYKDFWNEAHKIKRN